MPFDKKRTREMPFFDSERKEIGKVNMMFNLAPYSNLYFRDLESEIVELPYGEVSI